MFYREESIAKNVTRILKIWRERHIFPKDFLAEITELYGLYCIKLVLNRNLPNCTV